MPTREEVTLAYKMFLGREPESEEAISFHQAEANLDGLGRRLIASPEFQRRLVLGSGGQPRWVCTEIRNRLRLWVDLSDFGVSAGCLKDNWEPAETDFMLSILSPGDTFVDAGANIGWFSILAAHAVGEQGRVHAFEPREDLREKLLQSVRENGFESRCAIHPIALGAEETEIDLAWVPSERNPGHTFMAMGDLPQGTERLSRVRVQPLDSFNIPSPVRMMKIDVEGSEPQVIAGARELIERDKPILLIEIFPSAMLNLSNISAGELLSGLRKTGYRVFRVSSGGIGRELHTGDDGVELGTGEYFNVVALPELDARKLVARRLDQRVNDLERQLQTEREVYAANQALDAANQHALDVANEALQTAHKELEVSQRKIVTIQSELVVSARAITAANEAKTKALSELVSAKSAIEQVRTELRAISARRSEVEESTTWRATQPIRSIASSMPFSLRKAIRRTARLLWWTVTLQLPRRLKQHFRQRRMPGVPHDGVLIPSLTQSFARNDLVVNLPQEGGGGPRLPKSSKPRALIIDSRWPRPDRDSGSLDAINQIRALKKFGYEVIFVGEAEFGSDIRYRRELEAEGVICLGPNIAPSVDSFVQSDGATLDLIMLTRVHSGGRYLEVTRHYAPRARVVFITVDLHHIREEREARINGDAVALRRAESVRERELYITRQVDATIVVSASELQLLNSEVPGAMVFEMPLAREVRKLCEIPPFEERRSVGFVGGFDHLPNVDAAQFLLQDIWPLVRKRMPGVELTLVGAHLPEQVLTAAPEGVRYLGPLPDLGPWLSGLRLTLAPLRYGAGAKGKVVSSLAAGVPCVATPIAAEGMNLVDGLEVAVAEDAESFAEKICKAYQDRILWERLSKGGHTKALLELSLEAGEDRLAEMLRAIGSPMPELPSQVAVK